MTVDVNTFPDNSTLEAYTDGSGHTRYRIKAGGVTVTELGALTSAQLRSILSDESGTGAALFAGGALGAATALSINKVALTAPATSATLTIADGKTLTVSADATVSGTNTGDQTTVSGNAGTASKLATPRNINRVSFDGSAPIILVNSQAIGDADATISAGITEVLLTAALTAARVYTLPAANGYTAGERITFADIAGGITATNTATLQRAGGDTVNGATTMALVTGFASPVLVSDGTSKWTADIRGITRGGTGATTAAAARTNLGLGTAATMTGPAGTIVGDTDTQTLTNKSIVATQLTGTINAARLPAVAVQTGQANAYTTGAQDLTSATSLIVPASAGYAPTANASLGFDTTQLAWVGGGNGTIKGFFPRCIYSAQSSSDTVTASVVSTTETAFASTFAVPANFLIANKQLFLLVSFQFVASGSPPTVTMKLRKDNTSGATLFTGAAITPTASVTTSAGMVFLVTGTGAAGASVNTMTGILGSTGALATRNTVTQPVAWATNAQTSPVMTVTYSANTAGNNISLLQYSLWEVY